MMRFHSATRSRATLALSAALALSAFAAGCGSAIDSAVPGGGDGTTTSDTTGA